MLSFGHGMPQAQESVNAAANSSDFIHIVLSFDVFRIVDSCACKWTSKVICALFPISCRAANRDLPQTFGSTYRKTICDNNLLILVLRLWPKWWGFVWILPHPHKWLVDSQEHGLPARFMQDWDGLAFHRHEGNRSLGSACCLCENNGIVDVSRQLFAMCV